MPEDFSELQTLLRLKRHETPPPGYLEDFLSEFHHRQRAELLRRPLWRIALDRVGNWVPALPALPLPNLAYAGVSAVALLAAAGMFVRHPAAGPVVVVDTSAGSPAVASARNAFVNVRPVPPLAAVRIAPDLEETPFGMSAGPAFLADPSPRTATVASGRPRYLLDTRPVRYEPRSPSF